jgi:lysozyme
MIQGIDVSYHQGNIDWRRVKDCELVHFAYIRIGTGNGSSGFADPKFIQNYEGCKAVDLPCGLYHAWEPSHDPQMQFAFINDIAGGRLFELPAAPDVERPRNNVSWATTRARWAEYLALLDAWNKRKSAIYTSKWKWREIIQPWWTNEHLIDGHPLWVADYGGLSQPRLPSSWNDWVFWQTNCTGQVPGIEGNVDVNYFKGTAEEFLAFQNLPEGIPDSEKLARLWAWAKRHDPEFLGG